MRKSNVYNRALIVKQKLIRITRKVCFQISLNTTGAIKIIIFSKYNYNCKRLTLMIIIIQKLRVFCF